MNADSPAWQRRYRRERAARLEAEAIAERAVSDLAEANRDLDRRIVERTAQLSAALDQLEAARRSERTFLRGLAHEIRTPLNAILGLSELIGEQVDDEQIVTWTGEVHDAAARLDHALRLLIEFSAASGSVVARSPVAMTTRSLGEELADRWTSRAARRGVLLVVDVRADPGAVVEVDPTRLGQIVDPIIDNASRSGAGRIDLSVDVAANVGERRELQVTVVDDGSGVPAELAETLFEPFTRSPTSTGMGMGLALSRTVARALGGDVERLPSDRGAAFLARLPLEDVLDG